MPVVWQNVTTTSTIQFLQPCTAVGWFYVDTTLGVNQSFTFCSWATDNLNDAITGRAFYDNTSGDMGVSAQVRQTFSSGASALTSLTAVNGWHHGACVFTSNTLRKSYLDGTTNTTTDTVSRNPQQAGFPYSYTYGSPVASSPIAEVASWDVALTDAEIDKLAAGFPAYTVQPANMIHYTPGYAGNQDLIQGTGFWTPSGGTVEHDGVPQPPVLHLLG